MKGSEAMKFVEAKSLVQSVNHGDHWFGVDYNMNLYRGCCHGCIYCDSRSDCYQVGDFDTVRAKKDTGRMLQKELSKKRKKGVVGIGAMSDTYNPFEKQYEITREALQILHKNYFGVCIETKSDLIVRDIDVLKQIQEHSAVIVKLSVTTIQDDVSLLVEPHAPVSSKRLAAIKQLNEAGVYAGMLMMPLLPWIEDTEKNIVELVKAAHDAHVRFIYPSFGLTLRKGNREYFYEQLDQNFPGMRKRYERVYGEKYLCDSPNAKQLAAIFKRECIRYGIPYKMKDIIKDYKAKYQKEEQLSLF